MFWPFKKRKPEEPGVWDAAAQNLIAQGLDPKRVRRATKLVKRLDKMGALPHNFDGTGMQE